MDFDGTTGTVRMLARLDGYLTGKSKDPAKKVALKFVRKNHDALNLTTGDLKTFKLKREYVDIEGVHHLYWIQRIGGKTVFGNGLTAAVTKDGRLLTLGGSPVSQATLSPPAELEIESAAAAIADARSKLGAAADSRAGTTDSAEQVLFVTARGSHLAWMSTVLSVSSAGDPGRRRRVRPPAVPQPARRRRRRRADRPGVPQPPRRQARRQVHRGRPHPQRLAAPRGQEPQGQQRPRLLRRQRRQRGQPERGGHPGFDKRLVPFKVKGMSFCKDFPCSWDPDEPFSWKTNREQNATQVFYFVNNFHDHLLAKPIGFTEAAGNFEVVNSTKTGKGRDAVQAQTMDGANRPMAFPTPTTSTTRT